MVAPTCRGAHGSHCSRRSSPQTLTIVAAALVAADLFRTQTTIFVQCARTERLTWSHRVPSPRALTRSSGTEPDTKSSDNEASISPLKQLEDAFQSAADFYLVRRLDINVAGCLVAGVFNSYVNVAEPAEPPDCMSYSREGACCPSLACYRSLPYGVKTFVTIYFCLGIFNCLRTALNPGLQSSDVFVKYLFMAGVQASILFTLYGV